MTIIYTCNLVVREVYRSHLANRTCIEDIRNLKSKPICPPQMFVLLLELSEKSKLTLRRNPFAQNPARLEELHEETKQKLEPFADKLLPVTHDGGPGFVGGRQNFA